MHNYFNILQHNFRLFIQVSSTISIPEILADGGGLGVLERYQNSQPSPSLSDIDRQEIIRILMADMTKKSRNMYPSSDIKNATAKALVEFFPCLALIRPGVSSHCHFYNTKTQGFFDNRLKTMRKCMSPSKRKRKPSKSQKNKKAVKGNQQKNSVMEEDTLIKVFLLIS